MSVIKGINEPSTYELVAAPVELWLRINSSMDNFKKVIPTRRLSNIIKVKMFRWVSRFDVRNK